MLYLVESFSSVGKVLKIGYTNNIEKRFSIYKTCNPDVVLLATREGDEKFERKLHKYFSDFKYDHGREWFYYNEKIVDEFSTIQEEHLVSKEELDPMFSIILDISDLEKESLNELSESCCKNSEDSKEILKNRTIIDKYWRQNCTISFPEMLDSFKTFISIGSSDIFNLYSLLNNLPQPSISPGSSIFNICEAAPDNQDSTRKLLDEKAHESLSSYYIRRFNSFCDILNASVIHDREKYKEFFIIYGTLKTRRDKLKYLCEYKLVHGHDIDELLDLITEKRFKEYITVLGLDQCKATSYTPSFLDKRLNVRSFDKNTLINEIYQSFCVNNSYTTTEIKIKLGDIYKNNLYRATPKASDLEYFFEMKACKLKVNGKWENGFKLLSRKLN
jgi:hypothetical protein